MPIGKQVCPNYDIRLSGIFLGSLQSSFRPQAPFRTSSEVSPVPCSWRRVPRRTPCGLLQKVLRLDHDRLQASLNRLRYSFFCFLGLRNGREPSAMSTYSRVYIAEVICHAPCAMNIVAYATLLLSSCKIHIVSSSARKNTKKRTLCSRKSMPISP